MPQTSKILISASMTFLLIVETSMKDILLALDLVPCIYYPIWFKKNKIWTLINLASEVNTITLRYIAKLDLKICSTNIGAQKIDSSTLKIFEIFLTSFQKKDKLGLAQYF